MQLDPDKDFDSKTPGEFVFGSSNPGVFTDARCFMSWIANQYNMKMPPGYPDPPSSCYDDKDSEEKKLDIDKEVCNARLMSDYYTDDYTDEQKWIPCGQKLQPYGAPDNCEGTSFKPNCAEVTQFRKNCTEKEICGCYEKSSVKVSVSTCDFKTAFQSINDFRPVTECRRTKTEGFAQNIYQCVDTNGKLAICSNNCRGVNPNGIIIGGTAIALTAAVSGLTLLQPAVLGAVGLGALGAGAVGVGGAASFFRSSQCPNTRPCRVSHHMPGSLYGL